MGAPEKPAVTTTHSVGFSFRRKEDMKDDFPMRAILAGAALAAFVVTPTLADYYIVQEPTTKRCRIVEERPAPGVGVIIGGVGFGVRTEAESRMRTECRETTGSGGDTTIIQERERPVERR